MDYEYEREQDVISVNSSIESEDEAESLGSSGSLFSFEDVNKTGEEPQEDHSEDDSVQDEPSIDEDYDYESDDEVETENNSGVVNNRESDTNSSVEDEEASVLDSESEEESETQSEIERCDAENGLSEEEDSEEESDVLECDETNVYGDIVDTVKNPSFSLILQLSVRKKASTAHVTGLNGRNTVYELSKAIDRTKLKGILAQKKKGYTWFLRSGIKLKRSGLAEDFDPDPDTTSDDDEKMEFVPPTTRGTKDNRENSKTDKRSKKAVTGIKKNGSSQIKKGKPKKGEKKKSSGDSEDVDDEEGDEDEDSLFGDPKMKANLAKQVKEKAQPLVPVYVSPPFLNVADCSSKWVVIWGRPGNTFYAKAPHQKSVLGIVHERKMIGNVNKPADWINSVADLKIRSSEHGVESKWYKTSKGNTSELIYLVLTIPEKKKNEFHDILNDIIENYFMKAFKGRKSNPAGELALEYAKSLVDPNRPEKGLYNWLVNAKGKKDPVVAAKVMTQELDAHFKGGPAYNYDVSLDKFMVDWDIKQFLIDQVGINSWDDLDEESKVACYRDYPKRSLPEWDLMLEEAY